MTTAARTVDEIRERFDNADAFIEHYGDRQELELFTDAKALLAEVDRLNRAITRVLRLLADQEAYCGDERLDVPSWVQSVRKALNDAG